MSPHSILLTHDARGVISPSLPSSVLVPLCEGLCSLNARMSEEFLALAVVLESNSTRAREITVKSQEATGSEADPESSHSIELLQQILAESTDIGGMEEISTEQMLKILSYVNSAHTPLLRLANMQSLLKTVGLLSRIESGRSKNTSVSLSGLSKDIDVVAEEVQRHVDQICDDSSRLSEALEKGLRELRKFGQKERVQSTDLIRRTQAVLGPMIARSAASKSAARDIDEQYSSFHRSTDKVVVSLQSEDIARQRVEHVHEAICRVASSLGAGASMESCAGVLAVQRSQLVSTRDLLAESIRTIHSALQSLSPRIEELVLRTTVLAQQTGEDGQSFATVIDSGLETVSAVFGQRSSSVKAVMEIVNSVVPQVEEMTRGGRALEKIEASIHLISLNATVKLGQLGKEGATMDVIASELRSITREGGSDTRVVLDGLAAISEALARIVRVKATSESSLMMAGGEVVSTELSGLSQSVRISGRKMTEGLDQVRRLAETLCSELQRSCQLAVHASIVTDLFNEQIRSFDAAFGQLGYTKEMATVAVVVGGRQDDLSALYSMESERKLHLEVFGGEGNAIGNEGNSEFGDDVELF